MSKDIIKLENKSLSNYQILRALPKGVKFMNYKDLVEKCQTLDDALGPLGCLVLLYVTHDNYGHWCCVFKINDNTVEFFDSYGRIVDDMIGKINKAIENQNHERLPYLSKLMKESRYNLEYNDYKLQKKDSNVTTCGRHVICRLICRDMNIDEYVDKMFKNRKNDPDYIVTYLTKPI